MMDTASRAHAEVLAQARAQMMARVHAEQQHVTKKWMRGVVAEEPPDLAKAPAQRKLVVLAVDDKPANLLALEGVLESEYDIVLARSGQEALEVVQYRRDIDIVLMDVHMPRMDGFETATQIKLLDSARHLPIVFITAEYQDEAHASKGYEVGGVDYFYKPFDPEVLKLKLAMYARLWRKSALPDEREREEEMKVSEALRAAARKLAPILDTIPMGVIIEDVAGRICQINEAVSRIVKSVEPIQNDAYGEFLGWWNAGGRIIKEQCSSLWREMRGGETSRNELMKIRCLDGTEKTILCSTTPLCRPGGQIVGEVLVIQDVTETKEFGDDLQERVTKLVSLGVELAEIRI